MAEAALFIGWGEPVRGHEKEAVGIFNESVQYWARLQQEGRIERFDVAVLPPHGGDLGGFALMRGTVEQIDALRHDDEFRGLTQRVRLLVDSLGVVDALVDEGLADGMKIYQDAVAKMS